jgi:5-hydroxyisourate hydrolase
MIGLTTHVLDTTCGTGASAMQVDVRTPDGGMVSAILDEGGRATLLTEMPEGTYEILFYAAAYFGTHDFYDVIPVRFHVRDSTQHYHVPLILSRFGYSTYRGG